jgi:lysophospholipid acyltransferase (LPLAT)-like uncharacterized protein
LDSEIRIPNSELRKMFFKPLKKKLVAWLGPWFAYWTIKVLGRTMRFEEIHPEVVKLLWEEGTPYIFVFWHGRLLMMLFGYKGKKVRYLVSPHRDGQVVGKAFERFGYRPILGSTTRKGFSAFKEMVRAQKNGFDIAITPDGPRGPRYRAKIGVIELAKLTGRPLIPVTFSASKKIVFNTWDRFLLPYPFSRGVFIWGEPIEVDAHGDRTHIEEKRRLLEKRLNELTEKADHYFDSHDPLRCPNGLNDITR